MTVASLLLTLAQIIMSTTVFWTFVWWESQVLMPP